MSLGDYLRSIWHNWLAIVLATVAGAGIAFFASNASPDIYRSSSAVLLTSDRGTSTSELVQGSTYVQNLVATYVLLARSEIVLQPVIDELGLDTTPGSLASIVTASSPLNSVIIEIGVINGDPQRAQAIAAAVTDSLIEVVTEQVSPTAEDGTPTVRLTTIDSANEPRFPIAPNTRFDVILGALIGFAAGVLFAVIRALLFQTVRGATEVSRVTTVPVVGEIVETKRDATLPGAILTDRRGIEAESVRGFAANLNFLNAGEDLRSFVVTSASPAESKSSVVVALGIALAESGKRVLLVDADLRHPSLGILTQLESAVGLTNVLIGEFTLEQARQPWAVDGLDILAGGAIAPNPSQLLASDAMRKFLESARREYDIVIVDSAPLLSVTDAKWLGNVTDGALLVTRYSRTSIRALRRALESLEAASVPILGIAITRMPRRARARYGDAKYGIDADA